MAAEIALLRAVSAFTAPRASMRPRRMAAEIGLHAYRPSRSVFASMRPRRMAAEIVRKNVAVAVPYC